jgi:phage tail-like protein
MYQDDEFAQRFCGGLDRVLSPVIAAIESFDSYLDPRVAPLDFVEWLGSWVGLDLDNNSAEPRRRAMVAQAAGLYRWWGTARGIAEQIAIYTGVSPEIIDSGGVSWSPFPGASPPGEPTADVVVRLRVADPASVDVRSVEVILSECVPAHVTYRVEVLQL